MTTIPTARLEEIREALKQAMSPKASTFVFSLNEWAAIVSELIERRNKDAEQ